MEQFLWEMGRQKQNFLRRNYLSANTNQTLEVLMGESLWKHRFDLLIREFILGKEVGGGELEFWWLPQSWEMLQRQLRPWSVYPQSQVLPSPAATAVLFRQNLGKLLKYLMILYQKVRHCQSFLRRVLLLNRRRQKMTWVAVIFLGSTPGIQGRSWLFPPDCLFLFLFVF